MHDPQTGQWIHDKKSPEQHYAEAGLESAPCECGAVLTFSRDRPKGAPAIKCGHCGKGLKAKA